MKPSVDSSVKSVKRALDLLELLAEAREPESFLELMRKLEIPRSSLFHLMRQLISRGYVEESSGSRYRLGRMPATIGALAARRGRLMGIVDPVLRELSDTTNELSVFYVVEGDMARGLAIAEGTHALSYRIPPNTMTPLYAFSAGKVALAERTPEELEAYLATVERRRFTASTVTDAAALRTVVDQVRREGLGRSHSEYALGVAGFAKPVRSGGDLVGVVNVSVPEPRLTDEREALVIGALSEAVARLEEKLRGG